MKRLVCVVSALLAAGAARGQTSCPEGHVLVSWSTTSLARSDSRSVLQTIYRCPPEACRKEHRKLRQFRGFGRRHAQAQIGAAVLAYNLLVLAKNPNPTTTTAKPIRIPEAVPS